MNAYIFDIDGVITDLFKKEVTEPKILEHIKKLLEEGNFVAFNTGRSFSWTQEKVLAPLLELASDKTLFKNLFVVCEFGNVLAYFEEEKFQEKALDDPLPEDLLKKVVGLMEGKETMFLDNSKKTMISIEMKEAVDADQFAKDAEEVKSNITDLLTSDEYMDMNLVVSSNQIAIDVMYEDAGKALGAERIEDFMLAHGFNIETMYMFGDNVSDLEMAGHFAESRPVVFIFVGEKEKIDEEKYTFEIVYPSEKYTAGTLEFLEGKK